MIDVTYAPLPMTKVTCPYCGHKHPAPEDEAIWRRTKEKVNGEYTYERRYRGTTVQVYKETFPNGTYYWAYRTKAPPMILSPGAATAYGAMEAFNRSVERMLVVEEP